MFLPALIFVWVLCDTQSWAPYDIVDVELVQALELEHFGTLVWAHYDSFVLELFCILVYPSYIYVGYNSWVSHIPLDIEQNILVHKFVGIAVHTWFHIQLYMWFHIYLHN